MTRLRAVALVLLGASVPACNVLAGLTDEYRVADDAGADGGTADKDGALADGFVPGQEGGADALVDQGSGGGRFCEKADKTNLVFCNDFEDGDTAAKVPIWTSIENTLGAKITVVDNAGLNETSRGLDVDSTSGSTSTRNIILHQLLPVEKPNVGDYMQYDVELDFKVVENPVASDYLAVGVLTFLNASPEDHGIAVYPGDKVVARLTPKANGVTPALMTWHHAKIKLDRVGTGPSFTRTMSVDGTVVDNTTVSSMGSSSSEIRIGIFYTAGGAGRIHTVFDNIVVWRK
jgi:hypothetical protein